MGRRAVLPGAAPGLHGVDPGVVPDVGAVAPVLTKLKCVGVRRRAVFPDEDQLVLGPVARAHAAVVLVPGDQVFQLEPDLIARRPEFPHVAPVHTGEEDRPVTRMGGHLRERRLEERGELDPVHLARGHGELLVLNGSQTAHVSLDRHVLGRRPAQLLRPRAEGRRWRAGGRCRPGRFVSGVPTRCRHGAAAGHRPRGGYEKDLCQPIRIGGARQIEPPTLRVNSPGKRISLPLLIGPR